MRFPFVVGLLLSLLASAGARADSVVVEPPQNCRPASDAGWTLDGKRTVAAVLGRLAAITCETYVVPRALAGRVVPLALGKERLPAATVRGRVLQRLADVLAVEVAADARLFRVATSPGGTTVPRESAIAGGIHCRSNRCEVSRAQLDAIWADTDALARSVRIVPKIENGASIGFQLFGVRPGGVVAQLGFLNGDVVTHVNGVALGALDQALAAYSALRGANEIVVEGKRGGASLRVAIVVN